MDSKTQSLVKEWQASLTPQERELHALAAVKLKKTLKPQDMPPESDVDNGSYYADKCHAFRAWLKKNNK
jgi:hypothetical protein